EGIKLVAIFGAPAAYEDHAERAALAALEMQERLADVNTHIEQVLVEDEGRRTKDEDENRSFVVRRSSFVGLRQRIGLNLGTAFAGNVGSTTRKEYTVMGDAVNVAARVMSKADWGEAWCSEAAARAIEARMVCEERGYMPLKGKAAPLLLF